MLSLLLEFAEFSLGYYQVRYIFFKEPAENEIVRINTSRKDIDYFVNDLR